jgi:DNA-binding CsgD family transcriptional regulator
MSIHLKRVKEKSYGKIIKNTAIKNEIAININLSRRTIESYIENLKDKLNCHSKSELFQKCLELNSVNYFCI